MPQTTFEDWAGNLVFGPDKTGWPALRLGAPERPEDLHRAKFKESLTYRRLLDEGLRRLEEAMVPDRDVLIGDARIPAAQIRNWIQGRADRPLMVRTQRAIQLLRTWLKNHGFDQQEAEPPGRRGSSSAGGHGTRWTCTGISSWTRTGASTAGWGKGATAPFKARAQRLKEAGTVEAADLAGLVYLRTRLYGVSDSERWGHIRRR